MTCQKIVYGLLILLTAGLMACTKDPAIVNETMLDGDIIFDASLYHPEEYLVSAAIENPDADQLNTPVVIAVHGYSASTFEWDEFRSFCNDKPNILVSQVLLGGHGRTYEEFKESTWKDWQEPILSEYNALRAKGYTNINFAGSSTACPLVIDLLNTGAVGDNGLKNVLMVDPIVVSADKLLTIVGLIGPMLGYITTQQDSLEVGHWYHFRPQETLQQLMDLIDQKRKDLEEGITLPAGTHVKVYKSIKDPTADAVSAVLIYNGMKNRDGSAIDVEMLDSDLHVVTRLKGRDKFTQHDLDIQSHVFEDMYEILTSAN